MYEISLVTNPNGDGLLLAYNKAVYELTCTESGCQWNELQQKLTVDLRNDYVTMLIPDELASCSKKV
jgi:hypothetical protein